MLHDPNQTTLFPKLPEDALQQMQEHGTEIQLAIGEILFAEGEENYGFHIVLDGEIEITKVVGKEKRLLAIHHRGEFMGEVSLLNHSASIASAHATMPSRILRIELAAFKRFLIECAAIGDTILAAMVGRTIDVEGQLRQQEKLAALGKMSAGLAHELNNPAAAGNRAANVLLERFTSLQTLTVQLQHCLTTEQLKFLGKVQLEAIAYVANSPQFEALTQSDKEDEVTDWLENHDVTKAWQLAPTLVNAGIDVQKLAQIKGILDSQSLNDALLWLEANLATSGLINEVKQSTKRISELVKAVKGYTYMDTAPLQEVDIHEGLDNTLLILSHKLKQGIVVTKQYDRTIPLINAYGSELNQVWTNLIDNAIDAMGGKGELKIRTINNNCAIVEIVDNGTGIPPAIQSRIFEPFFTTKGVGEGTGLGLEIAYRIVVNRHGGNIYFESQPGKTCFRVHLPITQSEKS